MLSIVTKILFVAASSVAALFVAGCKYEESKGESDVTSVAGAGVLVYFTDGSETWTLLGYDHHYKVWCAFGGGKKGDKHSSDIALRELKEETRYVYGERIPVELENPFEEKEYHTYLASVPFQPVPVLLRASPERTSKDDNEMSAYIWIPLDELVAAVENCPDKEKFDGIDLPEKFMPLAWRKGRAKPNRKLRSAFARTLDKLKAEGRLADLLHR